MFTANSQVRGEQETPSDHNGLTGNVLVPGADRSHRKGLWWGNWIINSSGVGGGVQDFKY